MAVGRFLRGLPYRDPLGEERISQSKGSPADVEGPPVAAAAAGAAECSRQVEEPLGSWPGGLNRGEPVSEEDTEPSATNKVQKVSMAVEEQL